MQKLGYFGLLVGFDFCQIIARTNGQGPLIEHLCSIIGPSCRLCGLLQYLSILSGCFTLVSVPGAASCLSAVRCRHRQESWALFNLRPVAGCEPSNSGHILSRAERDGDVARADTTIAALSPVRRLSSETVHVKMRPE